MRKLMLGLMLAALVVTAGASGCKNTKSADCGCGK